MFTFLSADPVILDSSDPLRVPRIVNGVTTAFVAEGAQITDGDVALDEVTLLPSTLKSLKVLVRVSNELIRLPLPSMVAGLEVLTRAPELGPLDVIKLSVEPLHLGQHLAEAKD